jgi:4-amino-4-deoxy-L-arabinose transferase-like glycosyltransferase
MWFRLKTWCVENKYLIFILTVSVGLLFFHSSYRTFWGDEMAVLDYLKESPIDFLVNYWQRPDNHPPLYYFLVLLVSKILPGTELTVRLVSILSGLGIVLLVYKFAHKVSSSKKTALLTALFTALSSYFILISQMARYHSLAALLSLMVFYFFYQLFIEGYSKRVWCWYLVGLVLVGYSDYPHFFYVAFITNIIYLYSFVKRRPIMPFAKWLLGQLVVAIFLSPLVWMIYHRVVIQGDGGWDNINLLANSWVHIISAILFHIYSFFFGENIFPWNYTTFGAGITVLLAAVVSLIQGSRKKTWSTGQLFIVYLSLGLIVLNTFFMNTADPRYNFIVYPKFGFVAFPLFVIALVLCLTKLSNNKLRIAALLLWSTVSLFGLWNFYNVKNYLNPSYFRTFESFEYVRDHATEGEYLAITPNAGQGLYEFYKEKYFSGLRTADWREIPVLEKQTKMWFFAAGSEAADATMGAEAIVPQGYKILDRFDSVPLDPAFKKAKELILRRPSYTYKYSLFLLEKI